MKFYKCPVCGNIITVIEGDNNKIKCCGQEMEELIANKVDASLEKHVPIYKIDGDTLEVFVGEVEHPMMEEHYIMFIVQVFGDTINIVRLNPGDKPVATFKYIKNSKIYEYCNIHGLWERTID